MKAYYVTEFLTDGWIENACGIYTTEQKAKDAILRRVAELYTPEEMELFGFEHGVYVTPENEEYVGCTYNIDVIEMDQDLS